MITVVVACLFCLLMTLFAFWSNGDWYKKCRKMNDDWFEQCLDLNKKYNANMKKLENRIDELENYINKLGGES